MGHQEHDGEVGQAGDSLVHDAPPKAPHHAADLEEPSHARDPHRQLLSSPYRSCLTAVAVATMLQIRDFIDLIHVRLPGHRDACRCITPVITTIICTHGGKSPDV